MRNYYWPSLAIALVVGTLVGLFAPPFAAFLWIVLFLPATFIKEEYPPKLFGKFLGEDNPVFHVTIALWAGALLGLLYQVAH